jgi:8-oxo-dGTP diphosphatase
MNKEDIIQKTTVKGLFEKDRKIFLVKDNKGVWELPGGRIEYGEQPQEALRRELNEELSWKNVEIINLVDSWSFTSESTKKHFIVLIYLCKFSGENVKKSNEHIEYKWVLIDKTDHLNMRNGYKETIKKLFDKIKS